MAKLSDKLIDATVPIRDLTKRTKEVNLTLSNPSTAFNGTPNAKGLAYADSNDTWRLVFNITGELTSGQTSFNFDIDGIVSTSFTQGLTIQFGSTAGQSAILNASDNTIFAYSSVSSTVFRISGDVLLASKPSWADANLENRATISAYIPEASSTERGIILDESTDWTFYTSVSDLNSIIGFSGGGSYTGYYGASYFGYRQNRMGDIEIQTTIFPSGVSAANSNSFKFDLTSIWPSGKVLSWDTAEAGTEYMSVGTGFTQGGASYNRTEMLRARNNSSSYEVELLGEDSGTASLNSLSISDMVNRYFTYNGVIQIKDS